PVSLDEGKEGVGGGCFFAVDGDDGVGLAAIDVAFFVGEGAPALLLADDPEAAKASAFRRAAGSERSDDEALLGLIDTANAGFGSRDTAGGDELRDNALHGINRNGEADSRVFAGGAGDRGVHSDEAPTSIEERAAGVA